MNPKVVAGSVALLILVAIIVILMNPGKVQEEINVPIIQSTETTVNETQPSGGGGGLGGFFGGLFGGGSSGGSSGGGGGGGSGSSTTTITIGGSSSTTTTVIGGSTTTIIGGNSTTTTIIGGSSTTTSTIFGTTSTTSTTIIGSTTSTTSSTSTSTIFGTTSTTSTTSSVTTVLGSTTTSITGCASNFAITFAIDCMGTSGNSDDNVYAQITNNNPSGYALDVYVDNNLERSNYFVGSGGIGLVLSNTMTSWWRSQTATASRTFNVRIEYSGSCSIAQPVTIDFPSSNSQCVD